MDTPNGVANGKGRHIKNTFLLLAKRSIRTSACIIETVHASDSRASSGAKIKAFGYQGAKKNALQNYQ